MAYRIKRGMGSVFTSHEEDIAAACNVPISNWFIGECWSRAWDGIMGPPKPVVGVPSTPTGTALTLPPASGEEAAALQQQLADEALRRQQALNAAGVQSGVLDRAASVAVGTGNAVADAVTPAIP